MRSIYAAALCACPLLLLQAARLDAPDKERHFPSAPFNTPLRAEFAPSSGPPPKAIRAVSWNIDRGRQLPTIEAELARQHADLCLLQEVDWRTKRTGSADVAMDLARSLRLNMAYAIEFEELGQERQGTPAYIGQSTLTVLPIQHARVLRFATQSRFWKPRGWIPSSLPLLQRRAGGRIALVTELRFRGRPLVVYNVHLESRSMGSLQARQLDEILSDLKRYPPDTAIILGGDFNSKYFPSAFLKRLEQQGFRSATGERIERTHSIAMALDWIFVRGPLTVENGQVQRDFEGSDHYPVFAVFGARPGNQSR